MAVLEIEVYLVFKKWQERLNEYLKYSNICLYSFLFSKLNITTTTFQAVAADLGDWTASVDVFDLYESNVALLFISN